MLAIWKTLGVINYKEKHTGVTSKKGIAMQKTIKKLDVPVQCTHGVWIKEWSIVMLTLNLFIIQFLGNDEGYAKVFNIGDSTMNTIKFLLEYIKIENWSISH